ncbi:hypothetical protein [Streptomyces flavidovirens]
MAALLLAIVVAGIGLALVTAARKSLMARSEPAARPCCAPCPHACQQKHS